ncbi:hypothetical protein EW026_g3283 [Hermanssonia centrifuga]|uniref:Uncharacterized protein n=1 Tax=Hermanssonia centrifuga TaxID=98765 RepID=A0A4S4KKN1_9APHY|nr:hypothetical protein EW026_g3283 [Hermanssonia centrifuga]
MDSFIRSKYESRRWAMDGPPPSDPSVLENGETQEAPAPTPIITAPPSTSRPTHASSGSTSSLRSPVTRQPQPHQLLSASIAGRTTQTSQPIAPLQQQQAPAPAPSVSAANTDLFSLDFHNPAPPAGAQAQKKDMKQDILSLFSASSTSAPVQPAFGQYGGAPAAPALNAWGQSSSASPGAAIPPVQQTGMMGNGGTGMWGANSGWNATTAPALPNMWGSATAMPGQQPHLQQQPQQQNLLNTNDIWASSQSNGGGDLFGSSSTGMQKKDDVFGDIWGGFK